VVLLDGAKTLGAKILVAGGGRCNVTHHHVDERAFAGSTPHAIRKVLRRYDVPETVRFFEELGVELKREATGKLFPVTDKARTVLDALITATREAGVEILHPWRVQSIERQGATFALRGPEGELHVQRVVLATGGKSLPKSGSDGHGFALARALGHHTTRRIFQSLVPLLLPSRHALCALKGVAAPVRLELRARTGKRLRAFEGPLLCTHFGVSGPVVLDMSRYWIDAHADDARVALVVDWLPKVPEHTLDAAIQKLRAENPITWLGERLPARLAAALLSEAGIDPEAKHLQLTRAERLALVATCKHMPLPVSGPRGWTWAEVTAGGVPLKEVELGTMASRACPGLFLCGEILDVDGRIGGFNFQWAWASGYVAGLGVTA
jgi:predicted Rossmann fold flavoprotein